MAIDIIRGTPQDLLGLTLSELWDAVRAIETWTPRHAEVLDFVYRHLVLRTVSTAADADDVYALYEHLIRVANQAPADLAATDLGHGVDPSWSSQWRAYADLMDARLAVLQSHEYAPPGALSPEQVRTHAHVDDIVQAVQETPGIPQYQLGEKLGLTRFEMRCVVSLMVAVGLIVRRRIETENALHPGPAAGTGYAVERLSTVALIREKHGRVAPRPSPRYRDTGHAS